MYSLIFIEKHVVDLQKVLVPTTTKIINAIPQIEPLFLERSKSPVLLELATASLDLVLPATEIKYKIQSENLKQEDEISSNSELRNSTEFV